MKKQILIMAVGFTLSLPAFSQNIGINSTGSLPDNSAMLDVAANDKGVLVPRMSVVDRDNINAPANGLIVYNTDCNLLNYYDCDTWWEVRETFGFPYADPSDPVVTGKKQPSENEQGLLYSIPPITGAVTYNWTLPNGGYYCFRKRNKYDYR